MLRAKSGKNLVEALPGARGGNAQGKAGVCAIIGALAALPGASSAAFPGWNDFWFFMWNSHHA
jgi:hypothetical protein